MSADEDHSSNCGQGGLGVRERYGKFNSKRKVRRLQEGELERFLELASRVKYGGNPEHKKNPGDFGLTPPSAARRGKSLCDDVQIFHRKVALQHVQAGLSIGLVSEQSKGEWPQNVWAVTDDGRPLEAQLENEELGSYHGYPMPEADPLAAEIYRLWRKLQQ